MQSLTERIAPTRRGNSTTDWDKKSISVEYQSNLTINCGAAESRPTLISCYAVIEKMEPNSTLRSL
jgi:hypothetical protein